MPFQTLQMNCFRNKKVNVVQNQVFDLMDADGDAKLSTKELAIVAKHMLAHDIQQAKEYVVRLQHRNPIQHLQQLIKTKTPTKKHLKMVYGRMPHSTWQDIILPELQRAECQRLNNVVNN